MSNPPLAPLDKKADSDELLERFLSYVSDKGIELYPAQEEAILELFEGANVILNTPTGSGKSLVAAALHFASINHGRRSIYTCPIKALVNEKFLSLCKDFGAENVGMMTGDASVNRDAPILCCTAEILSNIALHEGSESRVQDVIMDEFHYYSDKDRGVAWQTPLLTMTKARFLLMSATFGAPDFFTRQLENLTANRTTLVQSFERPVPLDFEYRTTQLTETLEELLNQGRSPIYIVHFTQLKAAETAQNLISLNPCSREEREVIAREIDSFQFNSPYGKEIKRLLRHGIGVHHAGLLPKYRVLVEQLAQQGKLKIICGTDTLGVGVNVPIRTVVFTALSKYDGEKMGILKARDFHQICGRAGRKGFDDRGSVIAQAPEYVIENLKAEKKAAEKGGKKKPVKKSPEKGFINWTEDTFKKLQDAPPEALQSSFDITHGMILQVLSRPTDGCDALRQIIRHCHEPDSRKAELRRRAFTLFRSLVERNIIEILPERLREGAKVRVDLDLQEDFSLNQTLALYLLDTLKLLDQESASYPLEVLTLAESIVEDPLAILRKQIDKLKTIAVAKMKEEGVEYEERMERLEEIEHPKPNRDFIYTTFNTWAGAHPWVGQNNIRPKSIAREMFEDYLSFDNYIQSYKLHRGEGVLLRHLSGVYKILAHTVPDSYKTESLTELTDYLGETIRLTDSSLLEEWETLLSPTPETSDQDRNPERTAPPSEAPYRESSHRLSHKASTEAQPDLTQSPQALKNLIRDRIFRFLGALNAHDFESSRQWIDETDEEGQIWTEDKLKNAWSGYVNSRQRVRLDPEGRQREHSHFKTDPKVWHVSQTLVDPEGLNDWSADFSLEMAEARSGEVKLRLARIGPVATM